MTLMITVFLHKTWRMELEICVDSELSR